MIGYNDVNGTPGAGLILFDPIFTAQEAMNTIDAMVSEAKMEYEAAKSQVEMYSMFLEGTDEKVRGASVKKEEKEKNFVDKIGEGVIKLAESIKKFFEQLIEKIKGISFENKSDLDKLDIFLKKHPTEANDLRMKISSGEITLSDMKSLADLEATYEKCMKMLKDKDTDPNSVKGIWNKALTSFKEMDKTPLGTFLKATAGVLSAAFVIKEFGSKNEKLERDINDLRADAYKLAADLDHVTNNPKITDSTDRFHAELEIKKQLCGVIENEASARGQFIWKMRGFVADMLNMLDKKFNKKSDEMNAKFHEGEKERVENNHNRELSKAYEAQRNKVEAKEKYPET